MKKNCAIIVAGGIGKRLPGTTKKQFLQIAGIPILIHAVNPFIASRAIQHIVIVLPEDEIETGKYLIKSAFMASSNTEIAFVTGGDSRQESVYNGLQKCPKDAEFVLIHDGVRPFIEKNLISRLLDAAKTHGAAIPVTQIRYTLKRLDNGMVANTVPRQDLYEAHTPQVFDYAQIFECHRKLHETHEEFTDDAAIFEHFGKPVATVACGCTNMKITCPNDMEIAQKIYEMIYDKENS